MRESEKKKRHRQRQAGGRTGRQIGRDRQADSEMGERRELPRKRVKSS